MKFVGGAGNGAGEENKRWLCTNVCIAKEDLKNVRICVRALRLHYRGQK